MGRVIIKYAIISIPIALLSALLRAVSASLWVELAAALPIFVLTGFVFYELVQLITIEKAKKNAGIYISIIISIMFAVIALSAIFGVNDLVALVGFNAILLIMSVMIFNIARAIQDSRTEIGCLLYVLVFALIGFIIMFTILFFVGAFDTE